MAIAREMSWLNVDVVVVVSGRVGSGWDMIGMEVIVVVVDMICAVSVQLKEMSSVESM